MKECEFPPPPYHQVDPEPHASPPDYTVPTAVPLPTYDQSEKYKKEGVLPPPTGTSDEDSVSTSSESFHYENGTWCEFLVFFFGEQRF